MGEGGAHRPGGEGVPAVAPHLSGTPDPSCPSQNLESRSPRCSELGLGDLLSTVSSPTWVSFPNDPFVPRTNLAATSGLVSMGRAVDRGGGRCLEREIQPRSRPLPPQWGPGRGREPRRRPAAGSAWGRGWPRGAASTPRTQLPAPGTLAPPALTRSQQPPPLPGVTGASGPQHVPVTRLVRAGGRRALASIWGSLKQNPGRGTSVTLQPGRARAGGPCGRRVPQRLKRSSSQRQAPAVGASPAWGWSHRHVGATTGRQQEGTALPWPRVGSGFLLTPLDRPREPASASWFPSRASRAVTERLWWERGTHGGPGRGSLFPLTPGAQSFHCTSAENTAGEEGGVPGSPGWTKPARRPAQPPATALAGSASSVATATPGGEVGGPPHAPWDNLADLARRV